MTRAHAPRYTRGPSEVHARYIGLPTLGYRTDQLRAVLLFALRPRKTVRLSMRVIGPEPDGCCTPFGQRRSPVTGGRERRWCPVTLRARPGHDPAAFTRTDCSICSGLRRGR